MVSVARSRSDYLTLGLFCLPVVAVGAVLRLVHRDFFGSGRVS
jgi:hypothetical protein